MSDLLDLYKFYGAKFPEGLKTSQDAQANAIALDNARRAQQERMDLKALYAQQANPSFQAVGAIDPAFAIEYLKNQFAMQKDIVGMQHLQAQTGEIEARRKEEIEKLRIGEAVAIVNQYDQDKASGMPEPQALANYNAASGQALSMLKQRGRIPPDFPAFDPKVMNPEAVRLAGEGMNFYTEKAKQRQEYGKTSSEQQARVNVGPVMTPEQKLGSVKIDELTGLPYQVPPLKVNQPTQLTGTEGAGYTPEQNAQFNVLQELLNANPNDEALRRSVIAQRQKIELQGGEQPQSEIVTPQQLQTERVEQKANEETAVITAKKQAEEQQIIEKSLKAYETLPDINHIRDLVKGSIGGDIEYWTNRLGQTVGESLKAGDFQAALAVVASDMANAIAFAPGSQSEPELIQRLKQVGDLDSKMPIDQKMAALDEWYQGRQRFIGKYGKYSDDELIALGKEGKITHDTAMKVRANRKKGQ